MRTRLLLAAAGAMVLAAACASEIDVRTMSAPDVKLTSLHTFRILPTPQRRDGQVGRGTNDPMVSNSIMNLALRQTVEQAFIDRGYVLDERNPDFAVAFYASALEKLDVTQWNYGYPYYPRWRMPIPPAEHITTYKEGSVVIDIVHPGSNELMWRGHGTAEISDHPDEMSTRLRQVAVAVIGKFPRAAPREVATSR